MSEENNRICIFWFRRDLRIEDNHGFYRALKSGRKVLSLFIFDDDILEELAPDDARVSFIYESLSKLNNEFANYNSSIQIEKGKPIEIWKKLIKTFNIDAVYTNESYEPYDIARDTAISNLLNTKGITFHSFKDHVIREYNEVLKTDGTPYTVYTPYSKKWFEKYSKDDIRKYESETLLDRLIKTPRKSLPEIESFGFVKSQIAIPHFDLNQKRISEYENLRNLPSVAGTTLLGVYLRFGIISIREVIRQVGIEQIAFIKQLIWRDFFIQIMHHFPHVVHSSFKPKYDHIKWENNEHWFNKWCKGETGYPIVDAGMRELNQTAYMHNRVRMVTASFLCKHLLIDWRWGEAYFASKLLDYELASNNGNWQWASGTGCDAAPYFRVFNPYTQQQKFDPDFEYIKKWVPEYEQSSYPKAIVDHKEAREKAIKIYKYSLIDR